MGRGRALRPILKAPGAAFLDRDGTINVKAAEGEYIETPDQLALLPGAPQAIRRLNEAGVMTIVVTNQRGVARGRLTLAGLDEIHRHLREMLESTAGARLDGIIACPHEAGECSCRKPDTGMFLRAKQRWPEIDLAASAMIGDAASDVEAGARLGMQCVRLGSPAAADLGAAVDLLLVPDGH